MEDAGAPDLPGEDVPEERPPSTCGNGTVEADEECDDGNGVDWDGCTGCLITEFQVNTFVMSDQNMPSVGMAADASFVVVWTSDDQDGDLSGSYGQMYRADGSRLGEEFQVSERTAGGQSYPSVVMRDGGGFIVVWNEVDAEESRILAQWYDEAGSRLGSDVTVSTSGVNGLPRVALDLEARSVVTWMKVDGSSGDLVIVGRRLDAEGVPLGPEFQVSAESDWNQVFPEVAMAPGSRFVIAWQDGRTSLEGNRVHARLYDAAGSAAGGVFELVPYLGANQSQPSVAMDGEGRFVVAWSEWECADLCTSSIACLLFDEVGRARGETFQPHSNTGQERWQGSAAMAPEGGFVLAWIREAGYEREKAVHARLFDADGLERGPEFRVSVFASDETSRVNAAMAPDGRFVLVWHSEEQDSDGLGIFAQRFTAAGEPRGVLPW